MSPPACRWDAPGAACRCHCFAAAPTCPLQGSIGDKTKPSRARRGRSCVLGGGGKKTDTAGWVQSPPVDPWVPQQLAARPSWVLWTQVAIKTCPLGTSLPFALSQVWGTRVLLGDTLARQALCADNLATQGSYECQQMKKSVLRAAEKTWAPLPPANFCPEGLCSLCSVIRAGLQGDKTSPLASRTLCSPFTPADAVLETGISGVT